MKFSLSPDADGGYMSKNGRAMAVRPADAGKDFADEATFAAAFGLTEKTLYAARQTRLSVLAAAFAQPVTISGISLAVDDATQMLLNHFVTALQLALSQQPDDAHRAALNGANISGLIGPLIDSAGAPHDMTVGQGLTLMLGYVTAYGAARGAYLAKAAQVAAATTVEAVNAIA